MPVGAVVGYEREERFVLVGPMLQKLDGLVGEEIDRMAGKPVSRALIDDLVAVEAGRVAVWNSDPVIEVQLRHERHPEMELADHCGCIARPLDD